MKGQYSNSNRNRRNSNSEDRSSSSYSSSRHHHHRSHDTSPPPQPAKPQQGQQKDHYSTLGVSKTATPDEIKKAYRKLALKHHPDKNPNDPTAAARFQAIGEAYGILSDKETKERYDSGADVGSGSGSGSGAGTRADEDEWEQWTESDYRRDREREEERGRERERERERNTERRSRNNDRERPEYTGRSSYFEHSERSGRSHRSDRDERRPSSYESTSSDSPSRIPLRPFYPSCEICDRASCTSFHRWYTAFGYVSDYSGTMPTSELARKVNGNFGVDMGSLGTCSVCGGRSCVSPHRLYTREGALAHFFQAIESEEGVGSVARAKRVAERHFGPEVTRTRFDRHEEDHERFSSERSYRSRTSHDSEYRNVRDEYTSRRDESGYMGRGTSYVYGDDYSTRSEDRETRSTYSSRNYSPRGNGSNRRGTTYVYADDPTQRSSYSGTGSSFVFTSTTFTSPGGIFTRSSRGSFVNGSPNVSFQTYTSRPARRQYDDEDRYGSRSRLDPDYYDDMDDVYTRLSEGARRDYDEYSSERSSRRYW